eukprot:TRINITY_DN26451_c0_g1_i1.p1 TRINITY_DN26451_c0_g1~~TRINITY_DN26451_c0_g1_i1.p1  ORF type:complete len:290 (-),score=48.83 TRINITY_DN26451_c0_g1_i1:43-912(-)
MAAATPEPEHLLVIRNTFLDVTSETNLQQRLSALQRSSSDSSLLSRSSRSQSGDAAVNSSNSSSCFRMMTVGQGGAGRQAQVSSNSNSNSLSARNSETAEAPSRSDLHGAESQAEEIPPASLALRLERLQLEGEGCSPEGCLVDELQRETGLPLEDVLQLEREGVLSRIPRNDEGEITSVGSLLHGDGNCFPCVFWFRGECQKSLKCDYCHFRHPGQKVKRFKPNKKTREMLRALRHDDEGAQADREDIVRRVQEARHDGWLRGQIDRAQEARDHSIQGQPSTSEMYLQ